MFLDFDSSVENIQKVTNSVKKFLKKYEFRSTSKYAIYQPQNKTVNMIPVYLEDTWPSQDNAYL